MRAAMLAGLVAIASLTSTGCDSDRRAISRADLPPVDLTVVASVLIDDDGFTPERIEVNPGDAIEFRVVGDGHGAVAHDDRFTTGVLLDGETTLVILDTPGTVVVEDVADPQSTMEIEVAPEK